MSAAEPAHLSPARLLPTVATSVLALVLFSSWNRPLLYDEFVYFVAGSLSLSEVLWVIQETTTNVNQGVTGAYLLTDWALMQAFGAADWALRLPSLVFGVLFIVYALTFLRHKGVGAFGLALFPLFLLTQELVMHYVGEARTYMPLAAASIGLLTYYSATPQWRKSLAGRSTGWSAAIIGVLFHPYIAVYWPAVLLFGYWTQHRRSLWNKATTMSIVRWSNPSLVITGAFVYAGVALSTWARGRATAFVDPYNFLPGSLPVEIVAQNLYAFTPAVVAVIAAIALGFVAALLVPPGSRLNGRAAIAALFEPAVLFIAAVTLALLISFSSILADFWIFPRQWIASAAMGALALFWAGFQLQQCARDISRPRGVAVAAALTGLTVVAATGVVAQQVADQRVWIYRPVINQPDRTSLIAKLDRQDRLNDADWMEYAQVNVDQGGMVWPEFRNYYLNTDWSQFVLRD